MTTDPFIYLQFIRNTMAALPGTTEGLTHGTPAFYVQKKMLCRLWENGEVLVIRTDERDKWIAKDPDTYFFTDHYRNYPCLLVNLPKVDPDELKILLIKAWMDRASKTQLKTYQENIH